MKFLKKIKKKYWEIKRYFYEQRDDFGHIGYLTMDIRDPKEREKVRKELIEEIEKKDRFYERKIRENS